MSTPLANKSLSHAEIAREIRRLHPQFRASSNMVGQVRRGDTTSEDYGRYIPEASASLVAKAKQERKTRKPRRAKTGAAA